MEKLITEKTKLIDDGIQNNPRFDEKNINEELLNKARRNIESLKPDKQLELEAAIGWLFITDEMKMKSRENKKKQMKTNDFIALCFAMIGIITNVTSSYMYANIWVEIHNDLWSLKTSFNDTPLIQFLRLITTLTTVILEIFIIRHYYLRFEFMIIKQKIEVTSTFYSAGILWYMILECTICLFHSPPYLNGIYLNVSDTSADIDFFLVSLVTFRVYLILRFFAIYSVWADEKAEQICNECHTFGGISFAIKAELKEKPYVIVGILYGISVLVFGFALRNIELCYMQNKPLDKFLNWSYISNGFWCIIITTFTVGFGDFYPQNHVGRIIAVTACLWGTFLTSLMVVALTISVAFTPQEEKAYEEIKKQELDLKLKQNAIEILRNAFKITKNVNNPNKLILREKVNVFLESVKNFRGIRNYSKSKELQVSEENILHKLNEKISYEMDSILIEYITYVDEIIEYLKAGKEIQKEINTYTDKLEQMTLGIYESIEVDENL